MPQRITTAADSVKIGNPLGLVSTFGAEHIPPLRIFNGLQAQALQAGFADYAAEDFQSDYLCKKLQSDYIWMDELAYIKIASSRIGRFCDPMTGESRIAWARSQTSSDDDEEDNAIHHLEAPAMLHDDDYIEQDEDHALAEKRKAFLKKIDPQRLAKVLNVSVRYARDIRKDIIAKVQADHKSGLFGIDSKRINDYIPAPKLTPAKSARGRKKVGLQVSLFIEFPIGAKAVKGGKK